MDVNLKLQQWVVEATGSWGVLLCWLLDALGEELAGEGLAVYKLHSPCLPGWALD